MAILHRAQLTPSKIDLLRAWVPRQDWLGDADAGDLIALGAYRFDDPEGEVGIETHLLSAGARTLQVPLTYRGAPLDGAAGSLVGTTQHSVLGERWVYDACADPVYVRELARVIAAGATEAELELLSKDGVERRERTTHVLGSGLPAVTAAFEGPLDVSSESTRTRVRAGGSSVTVLRVLDEHDAAPHDAGVLTGTWPGHEVPTLLAWLDPDDAA